MDILKLLNDEKHISGTDIADELKVSRTAVWKAVQSLKDEGYKIESIQNKGYMLRENAANINQTNLLRMAEDSRTFQNLYYRESLESTQTFAKELLLNNEDAFIVVANEQTKGLGRFNREWASPMNEGLYISMVFRPDMSVAEIIRFNLFMSLALSDALNQSFNLDTGIKWPNDIFIGDKKVCGFLTEVLSESNIIKSIICGVGINLFHNDRVDDITTATSIEHEMKAGEDIDISRFLSVFISKIDAYYQMFLTSSFASIKEKWYQRSVIFGKELRITEMNESYYARPVDITDDGFLIVVDHHGDTRKVISADIEI